MCADPRMLLAAFDSKNSITSINEEGTASSSGHHGEHDEDAQNIIKAFNYIHNRLLMASFDEQQSPTILKRFQASIMSSFRSPNLMCLEFLLMKMLKMKSIGRFLTLQMLTMCINSI